MSGMQAGRWLATHPIPVVVEFFSYLMVPNLGGLLMTEKPSAVWGLYASPSKTVCCCSFPRCQRHSPQRSSMALTSPFPGGFKQTMDMLAIKTTVWLVLY